MKNKLKLLKFLFVMVCILSALQAYAQEFDVSGIVTSENGEAITGVNVVIEGTTSGTITDMEGRFSIKIPDRNAILIFSFVGFVTQKVPLQGQTVVNIDLLEAQTELEDVIVVGYGVQKKSDLTGSIASVSGSKLNEIPSVGVDQALQGRAAGVSVTSNTGMPGGNVSIQIRGISSINGTEPLIIVDGVRSSLDNLNPGDIESVEILKDASSAAI